ncbi:MAG: CzcE family metal-binding protein [Herminiimonas sp.]|jgi:hypothetical protein|nr:CzcE family metal-binding protein [Herminiimonas sp.]MDB5853823.1 CzcE family metal-binding protein [Herminiimonas sp.]
MKNNRLLLCALVAIALCGCVTRTSYIDLYGSAAPPADYQRTITITPTTRYVNVVGGDTIRFISNGAQFAWTFNVARTVDSFSLNDVAPAGVLDHNVMAYVLPDPKYRDAM